MAQLEALETWLAPLIDALQPAARAKLARQVAQDLRRSQAQRISEQKNPDGSNYVPRKAIRAKPGTLRAKKGAIKARQYMFEKLRTARWLKTRGDATGAEIGFLGRVARIASVHQWGQQDEVQYGGPTVQYPARELLGLTPQEIDRVAELVLQHVGSGK